MKSFWDIRSQNYDKLFWVRDRAYLRRISQVGGFKKSDVVLDVGSGTGAVATYLKDSVKHVVCVDISSAMLSRGDWREISVIKWDIADRLFVDNLFDKIVARMVFHHITSGFDRALIRCHDLLRRGGKLIVAEGIPPSDDSEVIDWYTRMFRLKEKRITFTENELRGRLKKAGFRNMKCFLHMNNRFSIKNWLMNSGLAKKRQGRIYRMHCGAASKIKKAYRMRFTDDDCIVTTKNLIVIASK